MAAGAIAPGARVLIRDAEWIVKRVDPHRHRWPIIQVVGVSRSCATRKPGFSRRSKARESRFSTRLKPNWCRIHRRSFVIAACIWKASSASHRLPAMICGSVIARRSMTCLTNSTRRCWRLNNRGSES